MATDAEERNGTLWVRKTVREIREVFKFWGVATIERIVQSLIKKGYVVVADFDEGSGKGARWIGFDFERLKGLKSIKVDCSTSEQRMFHSDQESRQNGTSVLSGSKEEEIKKTPRAYKEKIIPLYSMLDVRDPAALFDTGIMELMVSRHPALPFGEYYQKWWRSRKVNGGIGKRPRRTAPLDDYATDIESYFQNCVEMAGGGSNGNGHKKNSDDRPIWMASKK